MPNFRRNDQVVVIAGDDRGKSGKILKVEREAPVQMSNVMHLCGKCQTGVRVTVKPGPDGKRERYCARCGESIPRVR